MPDNSFNLFVPFLPLTKDDEEKREVWGWASLEEEDRAGEIMDYASSKENFLKWSADAQARTGGKSLGNIREMHGNTASGKAIHFEANDAQKGFYIGAKIVDDQTWRKISDNVLTGFSVGGKYGKRWMDHTAADKPLMRFQAFPVEISVVDVPAVPHATYTLVKRDGEKTQVEFQSPDGLTHESILLYKDDLPESVSFDLREYLEGARDLLQTILAKAGVASPVKKPVEGVAVQKYPDPLTAQTIGATTAASLPTTERLQANHPAASEVPIPTASRELAKLLRRPANDLAKDVQDAPGLIHMRAGTAACCGICKHFRDLGDGYCHEHDFPTKEDWTCQTFTLPDGTGGSDGQVHEAPSLEAVSKTDTEIEGADGPVASAFSDVTKIDATGGEIIVSSNKPNWNKDEPPVADETIAKADPVVCPHCGARQGLDLKRGAPTECAACNKTFDVPEEVAKAGAKCPSCGAAISLEKEGRFTCDKCGKMYNCVKEGDGDFVAALDKEDATEKLAKTIGIYEKDFFYQPIPEAAKSFPSDRSLFADPVNWSWPMDTALRITVMLQKYNEGCQRERYSPTEWSVLGRRLKRMASERTGNLYVYDPREKNVSRAIEKEE